MSNNKVNGDRDKYCFNKNTYETKRNERKEMENNDILEKKKKRVGQA
jgi:hypothetical protein